MHQVFWLPYLQFYGWILLKSDYWLSIQWLISQIFIIHPNFSQWYGYHEWNMSECLSTRRWLTSGMHDSSVVHCIFLLSRLLSLSFCKSLIHCKQWLTEVNWSNFAFHKRQYTFWSGFQVGFCSQYQSIIIVWYLISIFYLILCRIFCQKLSDEEEESTKSNVYMFDMFSLILYCEAIFIEVFWQSAYYCKFGQAVVLF